MASICLCYSGVWDNGGQHFLRSVVVAGMCLSVCVRFLLDYNVHFSHQTFEGCSFSMHS